MGKLIDIDFAIIETLRVHPDFTPTVNALYMDNMTHPEGPRSRHLIKLRKRGSCRLMI